jgi:hypothetical protein
MQALLQLGVSARFSPISAQLQQLGWEGLEVLFITLCAQFAWSTEQ